MPKHLMLSTSRLSTHSAHSPHSRTPGIIRRSRLTTRRSSCRNSHMKTSKILPPLNLILVIIFLANTNAFSRRKDFNRSSMMTFNQGIIPNSTVTIAADCCSPSIEPSAPPSEFPEIELVSRSTDDKSIGTFYSASAPAIGGKGADEGRYVAFVSNAAGLGGSKGSHRQ